MDKEYIDCTRPTNAAEWHANNCSICSNTGTDLCPYRGKGYKKREPLFCDNRLLTAKMDVERWGVER